MDFSKPWKDSNLILKVEGESFHVHRIILSLKSPVFDCMFNSEFLEKNSNEINLPGKNIDEIEELLQILYDGSKKITDANFAFLLQLSDEYQITNIRSQCIEHMKQANKSGLNAIKYISYARKFNIKSLEDVCLRNIKTLSRKTLNLSQNYEELDESTKLLIMETRVDHVESVLERVRLPISRLLSQLYAAAYESYKNKYRRENRLPPSCKRSSEHKDIFIDFDCHLCRRQLNGDYKSEFVNSVVMGNMESLYMVKHLI